MTRRRWGRRSRRAPVVSTTGAGCAWRPAAGIAVGLFGAAFEAGGDDLVTFFIYAFPIAVLLFVGYLVYTAVQSWREDDTEWRRGRQSPPRRRAGIARNYEVSTTPPSRIEIDPAWPGRTRIRIPAPAALPMLGPARFVPPQGQGMRARYRRLRWEGLGAADGERWEHLFEPDFQAIRRAAGQGGFSATLNSAGLIIHLPFVVPRDDGLDLLERHTRLLSKTLGEIAEREERALGLSFVEVEEQHTAECSCCWTPVAADAAVICPVCGGLQHPDCAEWAGGCGRFACAGEAKPLERDTAA